MRLLKTIRHFRTWINLSIRRRLITWSIVFWVISVSVLSLAIVFVGQGRMASETSQRNTQMASVISRDINAKISGISADVRAFTRYLETAGLDLPTQAEAILQLRLASPQRYPAAYFFDTRGDLIFGLSGAVDSLVSLTPEQLIAHSETTVPEEGRSAYSRIAQGNNISEVTFVGMEKTPVVYISNTLSTQDQGGRVLMLEVNLSDIWQSIDLVGIDKTGFAYLTSRNGIIIAHPEQSYIGRQLPSQLEPLLSGYEGSVELFEPYQEKAVLAAYSPVGGQLGWGVVIQQDRAEAYAMITQTGIMIAGIWLALAVIGTLSIMWLIGNFTKPIVKLTGTAQEIAQTGDLSQRAEVKSGDEIGKMGQAFNQMIGRIRQAEMDLRQAYDSLELRVKERTADLSNANTKLQQEITPRREIEAMLSKSEAKYRDLVENADTIVLEMDSSANVIFFNKFAQRFFGYSEEEILGHNVLGTIVPEVDSNGISLRGLIEEVTRNPEKYSNSENENICRNGQRVWVAWTNKGVYDKDHRLSHILCIGIDRTEQKRTSDLLAEQMTKDAAEAERTRLARDLHDAVSQTLFSASIIADVLPRIWDRNREDGMKRLVEVRQLTRGALAEMRTLLFELRPVALENAEINELLKHLADSITGRARIPVALEIQGTCKFPVEVKIALYRITQEALNNIAKHSGASQANVKLACQDSGAVLEVADNGRGFAPETARPGSLGLGIMHERAAKIGASLDINSSPNNGTRITVIWKAA